MDFQTLHEMIPLVVKGKKHILTMHPYNAITLAMPGRHALDTEPIGGDFVVMVDDETKGWTRHQFTHVDLFADLERKTATSPNFINTAHDLMREYLSVVQGAAPSTNVWTENWEDSLHPQTFLYAVQCLAVAEHRRYAKFEKRYGGRYLPFRFGAGIVEGLWTATDAAQLQRRGRPGVEQLERQKGLPALTKELIQCHTRFI